MASNPKGNPAEMLKGLLMGLGGMAEMAHTFYNAMLGCGASTQEATTGMTAFIQAFWHESMQDARRSKAKSEGNDEADQLDP